MTLGQRELTVPVATDALEEAIPSHDVAHRSALAEPASNSWLMTTLFVRYAVAVVSVTGALIIARLLQIHLVSAPASLFLCAIMFSAWFGGARPALFALTLGGRLEVTSRDRDTTGTTVRVRLPLVADAG